MATDISQQARRLRDALEPVAGGMYVAPEAYAAYEALGFGSPVVGPDGRARPEPKAYFTSRGACMGTVSGEVVAAAFGCFNPKVVVPCVTAGWQITTRDAVLEARLNSTIEMLKRVIGEQPEGIGRVTDVLRRAADVAPWTGRPLFGGLRSQGFPGHPLGDLWRAADQLREHRGDSHVIAWAVAGADAVEILLLTEGWWGLPARSFIPSRGWNQADMDAGFERLQRRGLMTTDEKITDAGRAFREQIEIHTDELERPVIEAIGSDMDEVLDHLRVWSGKITAAGLVPPNDAPASAGGGPHLGTGLTIDTAAELYESRK
jgi:hypothetical protein